MGHSFSISKQTNHGYSKSNFVVGKIATLSFSLAFMLLAFH